MSTFTFTCMLTQPPTHLHNAQTLAREFAFAVCARTHARTHARMHARERTRMCAHSVQTHTHTHAWDTDTHVHTNVWARTHTHSDAHSCTRVRTHTHQRTPGAATAVVAVKTASDGLRWLIRLESLQPTWTILSWVLNRLEPSRRFKLSFLMSQDWSKMYFGDFVAKLLREDGLRRLKSG